jgi:hypothetical protein
MNKDDQRAAVLRFYYEHNEKHPGGHEQTAVVARETNIESGTVLEAQQYLVDKGLLSSGPQQQVRSLGRGLVAILARITDRGIDFVEHPADWRGREIPSALVNIFSHGNVSGLNVAGRDQQVVGGDLSGSIAQGNATANVRTFPIEQLRKLLENEPEALEIAEELNVEISSAKPRWGRVLGALETFNSVVVTSEAAHHIVRWLQDPTIPEFVQHGAKAILGS